MSATDGAASTVGSASGHQSSTVKTAIAALCLGWYIIVATVCILGHVTLVRYYSSPPPRCNLTKRPHVTIIRPVKGPETYLFACLASTFLQAYPPEKLHIRFCVASRDDPSLPVLERLCRDFPHHDVRILVEEEDDALRSGRLSLGPNPKIRNMSRAYREARDSSDLVWILDCNVWVGKYTLERMLVLADRFEYVHLTPITTDTSPPAQSVGTGTPTGWGSVGGRIDEVYLSTYHAKFYAAANITHATPAVVGKSTMFHISRLDAITLGKGIDYFSENICEDQLMGELFWRTDMPEAVAGKGEKRGKHALCFGDLAVQPLSGMSVREYWGRRVRWVRVRPETVKLATLVELGTESLICSLYGAFALTTIPFFHTHLGIPPTWASFAGLWLLSVVAWCAMDWRVYCVLQSNASVHVDDDTPAFARPVRGGRPRPFREWVWIWLAREALGLPIWLHAVCGRKQVDWRGKKFWVGADMKVHAVRDGEEGGGVSAANGRSQPKSRWE